MWLAREPLLRLQDELILNIYIYIYFLVPTYIYFPPPGIGIYI